MWWITANTKRRDGLALRVPFVTLRELVPPPAIVCLAGATAFAASLVMTPAAAMLARRWRFVAMPSQRGVHVRPTPLLGGTAVVLGIVLGACAGAGPLCNPAVMWTIAIAVLVATLGVVDDRVNLHWHTKLVMQLAVAALYVAVSDPLPGFGPLGHAVALIWLVVMMNAVNLIDNSDGLASGTAGLAAGVLGVIALAVGHPDVATLALAVAGAAAGFFIHNYARGSIFLGDGGSLPLGFLLGALALLIAGDRPAGSALWLALPLGYPLFDLAFVVIARWRRGSPIVFGGTDHTVHLLANRLGSLRVAVGILLGVSALLGAASIALELP